MKFKRYNFDFYLKFSKILNIAAMDSTDKDLRRLPVSQVSVPELILRAILSTLLDLKRCFYTTTQ